MVDVFAVCPAHKGNTRKDDRRAEQARVVFERRLAPLVLLPEGEDGRHDASPAASIDLRREYPRVVVAATSSPPLHPALNRPLLDAWAMTSLEQHEGRPEVNPWLRGWDDEDDPQTTVVWRKHLPSRRIGSRSTTAPEMVAAYFRVAPIHPTEKLEAESARVLDWLLRRTTIVAKEEGNSLGDGDVLAIVIGRDGELVESANVREIRRLAAPKGSIPAHELRARDQRKRQWQQLLSGCVLVVDERVRGCRDGMLDEKSDAYVASADADELWRAEKEDAASARPLVRFRVESVTAGEDAEGFAVPSEVAGWRQVRTFETYVDEAGVTREGLAVSKWHDDAQDEESRSILSTSQLLSDHERQVASRVRRLSESLGMPAHEVEALVTAAKLHDEGKSATRWQRAMGAPLDGIYAKTRGGGNLRLLEGYRHEFGSLIRASQEELPELTRDLILHLIAAHHGYARPLISHLGCEDGPPSQLESVAGEAARRFARLSRQYGPWGLAWREAILRAADQAVSRELSSKQR